MRLFPFGTCGKGTVQVKLCQTCTQTHTHTHAVRCCPRAPVLVRMVGVKCFVPDCQPLWAIYRHGDMSAFIRKSLSLSFFSLCVYLARSVNLHVLACIRPVFLSVFGDIMMHLFMMQHASDLTHGKPNVDELIRRPEEYSLLKMRTSHEAHLGLELFLLYPVSKTEANRPASTSVSVISPRSTGRLCSPNFPEPKVVSLMSSFREDGEGRK